MKPVTLHIALTLLLLSATNQCFGQPSSFFIRTEILDPGYPADDDSIYVTLNPSVAANGKLLIFLPGTGAKTRHYLEFPNLAASLGYRCISLSYPNGYPTIATICAGSSDADCYYDIRREVCYGEDVSANVDVDPLNSIYTRLVKTLEYLIAQYPQQQWEQFLDNGEPEWENIAVSGHSQGSGHALYLAKTQSVDRLIMFAGANDYSNYYSSPASWTSLPGITPVNRFFSFLHLRDDVWDYSSQYAVVQATGMTANDDSTLTDNQLPPYGHSHCLYTDLVPEHDALYSAEHNGVVVDFYVPGNSQPVYVPVWTYMLSENAAGILPVTVTDFVIYPNPAGTSFLITLSGTGDLPVALIISSVTGEIVHQEWLTSAHASVDLSGLPVGTYLVQAGTGKQLLVKTE